MRQVTEVKILDNEYWYGGFVYGAEKMPIYKESTAVLDLTYNMTTNQAAPLLLSSAGRYLWQEGGFVAQIGDGCIRLSREVDFYDEAGDLRGAYLDAMKRYFPFHEVKLDQQFFTAPVYNSWIELTFDQNEADILTYAENILKNDMPPGVLMIDDGWSDYYGKWSFNRENFPHAEEMIKKLHEMGFSVMLWICPFITPDTKAYRETKAKGFLIMNPDSSPCITEWWNGYSAALDLSNPGAVAWLDHQLHSLQQIGIDGFKLDAGDSFYYRKDQKTYGNVSPNEMSRLWCVYGEQFAFNEFRAAYRAGGMSLMQRLCDKPHSWEKEGVRALIPDTLAQGILGMPFGSPDMIGGGEYMNFWENSDHLDEELFVRHSEIACMLPVMQFSAAPWRVLGKENLELIKKTIRVREQHLDDLLEVIEDTKRTGEPIIRYMEYEFPNQSMAQVTDQFMVGSKLLVAPGYEKGKRQKNVVVPEGEWSYDGKVIKGDGKARLFDTEPAAPVILRKES